MHKLYSIHLLAFIVLLFGGYFPTYAAISTDSEQQVGNSTISTSQLTDYLQQNYRTISEEIVILALSDTNEPPEDPLEIAVGDTNDAIDEAKNEENTTEERLADEVSEAVEQADYTLDLAKELLEDGSITPERSLYALTVVDDSLNLIGESSKQGVDVDSEAVAKTLQRTSTLLTAALDGGLNQEGLEELVSSTNNIVRAMPTTIAAVDVNEGLDMIEQMSGIIASGINASLSSSDTDTTKSTEIIDGISDLIDALDLDTTITGNTNIVSRAEKIISGAVTATNKSETLDKTTVVAQIQSEISDIIGRIRKNMLLNFYPFTDYGASSQKLSLKSSTSDFLDMDKVNALTEQLRGIIGPLIESNIPLNEMLMGSLENLLDSLFSNTINALALSRGIESIDESLAESQSALQAAISANPNLLKDILEIASVDVSTVENEVFFIKTMVNLLVQGHVDKVNAIVEAMPVLVKLDNVLLEKDALSPHDIINNTLIQLLGSSLLSSEIFQPGRVRINFESDGNDNEDYYYSLLITSIDAVSSTLPDGMYFLSNGELVTISDNIAVTFAPTFNDSVTLINTLINLGTNFKILDDCRWTVDPGDGSPVITGMTGYGEVLITDSGVSDAITITLQGNDPADEDYALQVIFQGKLLQVIPPAIYDLEAFTEQLRNLTHVYSIDRNTGVITFEEPFYYDDTFNYKPDYVMNRLSNSEMEYLEANANDQGIAWQEGDYNQDGLSDIKMLTDEGSQIIYQLKP